MKKQSKFIAVGAIVLIGIVILSTNTNISNLSFDNILQAIQPNPMVSCEPRSGDTKSSLTIQPGRPVSQTFTASNIVPILPGAHNNFFPLAIEVKLFRYFNTYGTLEISIQPFVNGKPNGDKLVRGMLNTSTVGLSPGNSGWHRIELQEVKPARPNYEWTIFSTKMYAFVCSIDKGEVDIENSPPDDYYTSGTIYLGESSGNWFTIPLYEKRDCYFRIYGEKSDAVDETPYTLTVNTEPTGCSVWVAGSTGTPTAQGKQWILAQGVYQVSVSKEGYLPKIESVNLTKDTTLTITLTVEPIRRTYMLTVMTTPKTCNVTVNAVTKQTDTNGIAQFTGLNGTYTIIATSPGYIPANHTVSVNTNRYQSIVLNTTPSTPGFEILGLLIAIGVVALLMKRRI